MDCSDVRTHARHRLRNIAQRVDTTTSSLVTELVGFNLGIELTQLMVLALVMPSLRLLSRTDLYPEVRITLATVGIVLATAWLLERTEVLGTDPFDGITNSLVEHQFVGASGLAALAATTWLRQRHTTGSSPSDTATLVTSTRSNDNEAVGPR